jgi:hypothetical protein
VQNIIEISVLNIDFFLSYTFRNETDSLRMVFISFISEEILQNYSTLKSFFQKIFFYVTDQSQ